MMPKDIKISKKFKKTKIRYKGKYEIQQNKMQK